MKKLLAIIEADLRKLRHDPSELFTRTIQPIIWITIFGQAMAKANIVSVTSIPYLDYMAPGILAQSILLIAIFYGLALIWEKDIGSLYKILVTPTPRFILVLGRSLAAGIRGIAQVFVVYLLSFVLGIHLRVEIVSFLLVVLMGVLIAALFSTFSLIIACIVKKRERFMGLGQVMIMPLFFASNALYPIALMPKWLKAISAINPLTYQVDALRSLMIYGQTSNFGLATDFAVSIGVFLLFSLIATKLYPKILY